MVISEYHLCTLKPLNVLFPVKNWRGTGSSSQCRQPLDTDPLHILHTSSQQLRISFQYIFLHVFYASKISLHATTKLTHNINSSITVLLSSPTSSSLSTLLKRVLPLEPLVAWVVLGNRQGLIIPWDGTSTVSDRIVDRCKSHISSTTNLDPPLSASSNIPFIPTATELLLVYWGVIYCYISVRIDRLRD